MIFTRFYEITTTVPENYPILTEKIFLNVYFKVSGFYLWGRCRTVILVDSHFLCYVIWYGDGLFYSPRRSAWRTWPHADACCAPSYLCFLLFYSAFPFLPLCVVWTLPPTSESIFFPKKEKAPCSLRLFFSWKDSLALKDCKKGQWCFFLLSFFTF